jgi:hypothetical protein
VSEPLHKRRGLAFWLGVLLIVGSFLIYPAYPTIALLDISVEKRVLAAVLASILSWGTFFLGSALAGRDGLNYIRARLTGGGRKKG